jgi:flagellar biogenesis protein FliO
MLLLLLQTGNPAAEVSAINSQILDIVKTVIVLVGVLLLAIATIRYLLPRFAGFAGKSGGPIQLIARYPLEPRKSLYIVKTGSRFLVLGTADSSVHLITSLDPEDIEPFLTEPELPAPNKDFSKLLRGFRK